MGARGRLNVLYKDATLHLTPIFCHMILSACNWFKDYFSAFQLLIVTYLKQKINIKDQILGLELGLGLAPEIVTWCLLCF